MPELSTVQRQTGIRQRSLRRHCRLGRATELVFVLATGVALVVGGAPLLAQTWTGNVNSNWSVPANWSTGAVPSAGGFVVIDGTGAVDPVLNVNSAALLATDISAGVLTVDATLTTGFVDVFGTGTLTINATGEVVGDVFQFGTTVLNNNGTITGSLAIFSGVANNAGVVNGATSISDGNLNLNAGTNLTGDLFVNGGTVTVSAADTLTAVFQSNGVIAGAETLSVLLYDQSGGEMAGTIEASGDKFLNAGLISGTLGGAGATTIDFGTTTVTGSIIGDVTVANNSVLRLEGVDAVTGSITTTGSTISYGNGQVEASAISIASLTTKLEVLAGEAATQTGVISSTGVFGFEKSGAGNLTVTGANTYTGVTSVTAGTLTVENNAGLGADSAGTIVAAGATLALTGGIAIGAEALGLSGTGIGNNGALRGVSGGNTIAGAVSLLADSRIGVDADSLTLSGVVSGGQALTKVGDGTLVLSGANTYTGATTVSAGTLRVTNATALGTDAAGTTVQSGATLAVSGDITIGAEALSLSGTGIGNSGALRGVSGDNTIAGAVSLLADSRIGVITDSLTLSGVVSGAAALTKVGDGTLILSGANTYTGVTTITAGQVALVSGTAIADSGVVVVGAGGSLDVAISEVIGSISGAGSVVLGAGAQLSVGDATNTVLSGNVSGGGGSALLKTGTGGLTLNGVTSVNTLTISNGSVVLGNAGNTINTILVDGDLTLAATGAAGGASIRTTGSTITLLDGVDNASAVEIASNTTQFVVNGADAATQSGIISENAAGRPLEKIGTGTLTLTAANTYTGSTTVTAGTLALSNTGVIADVLVSGAGTFSSSGTAGAIDNAGTLTITGGSTGLVANIGTATSAGTVAALVNIAGTFGNSGTISGTTGVAGGTVTNTGTLTGLATVAGGTLASSGTIGNATVNAAGTLQITGGTAGDIGNTGTLTITAGNTGQVTNSATATNAGTVAALVNTAGTFDNSGTISGTTEVSGGTVTNTGTLTGLATVTGGVLTSSNTMGNATVTAPGTLQITGGTAGAIDNAGTLTITAGNTGQVTNSATATNAGTVAALVNTAGSFGNTGTISGTTGVSGGTVTNTGTLTGLATVTGGVLTSSNTMGDAAVSAAGTLQITGGTAGTVVNAATLEITDGAVNTVTNSGMFDITGGTVAAVNNSGTASNAGTVGTLINTGGTFANTGSITGPASVSAGVVSNSGSIGGLSTVGSGGTLLSSVTLSDVDNAGTLTITGGTAGAITNTGTASNAGTVQSLVNTNGSFTNSGTIGGSVTNTGVLVSTGTIAGNLDNSGAAEATLSGSLTGALVNRDDGAVILDGDLAGIDSITQSSALDFEVRSGTTTLDANATVLNQTSFVLTGGSLVGTNGVFNNASGATLRIEDGAALGLTVNNAAGATMQLDGAMIGALSNLGDLELSGDLTGNLTNAATGVVTVTGLSSVSGELTNTNTVSVAAGGTLGGGLLNNLATGTVSILDGGAITASVENRGAMTATGTTTIGTNVTNLNRLTVSGTAAVLGDFTNASGATISLRDDIGGDRITIAGDAVLNGTILLDVDIIGGASTTPGDSIAVTGNLSTTDRLVLDFGYDRDVVGGIINPTTVLSFGSTNLSTTLPEDQPTLTAIGLPVDQVIIYALQRNSALDSSNNPQEVFQLVSGVNPGASALVGGLALTQSLIGSVVNRPSSPFVSGLAAPDDEPCGIGSWGRVNTGRADASGTTKTDLGSFPGEVSASFSGVQAGIDYSCFGGAFNGWDLSFGAILGGNKGKTRQPVFAFNTTTAALDPGRITSINDTDFTQTFGGVYVGAARGRLFADLQYRADKTEFDLRNIATVGGSASGVADQNYTSRGQTLSGSVGYSFPVNAEMGLSLVPSAGFSFSNTSIGNVTFVNDVGDPDDDGLLVIDDIQSRIGFASLTLARSRVLPGETSAISYFGTATLYNDFSEGSTSRYFVEVDGDGNPVGRGLESTSSNLGAYSEVSLGLNYTRLLNKGQAIPARQMDASVRLDSRFSDKLDSYGLTAQFRLQF